MRLRFTADARADLRGIIRFGSTQWGVTRARGYVGELRRKLLVLTEHPHLGSPAEEISPGLRRYSYISHVAYYRLPGDEVRIVRILHAHMRAEDHVD